MKHIEKLLQKITLENVDNQIKNGCTNVHIISEKIIGENEWKELPAWERTKLNFQVKKLIIKHKLLDINK